MLRSPLYIGAVRRAGTVIVGSGLAGLSAALGLGNCVVVTRGKLGSGSSEHAQGGIAAAVSPGDSAADHAADTLAVSAGLADPAVVCAVAAAAAGRIEWLRALGAGFDLDADGRIALGREAGHRASRIVHAGGDATGVEVMRVLTAAVEARPDIEVFADHDLIDLIRCGSQVVGVLALTPHGGRVAILTPAVVLATGGIGGVYAHTTNPAGITGDGLAAAARAGAALADLEFVQFHPTALDVETDPAPLLTEALRGEGAVLLNEHGERFMPGLHPDAELAPRDVLARAIWRQRTGGRKVYLDARAAVGARFPQRFPSVWRRALAAGLDARTEPLPVTPAQHYFMGGIATDLHGRTSLPGLWAVGEVAATGLHGANRLASNSLLEGLVLGAAASASVAASGLAMPPDTGLEVPVCAAASGQPDGDSLRGAIRSLMWKHVGLVRDQQGLATALAELERLHDAQGGAGLPARNLLLIARLIASAALQRTESRGAHWRADYPDTDPAQQHRRIVVPPAVPTTLLNIAARRSA